MFYAQEIMQKNFESPTGIVVQTNQKASFSNYAKSLTKSKNCQQIKRRTIIFQSDEDSIIQFKVDQFHLPCGNQWLKIRDGNALSSNLLADLSGVYDTSTSVINSTGPNLLLEYFSDENSSARQICGGGFLAHASQISTQRVNSIIYKE